MSQLRAFHIRLVSDITEHCFRETLRASCAHSIERSGPYVAAFTRWRLCLYHLSVWCLICLRQFSEPVRWVFYPPKHLIFQVSIWCFDIQADCMHSKGASTCFVTKSFLKWNLSYRKQGLSTYITVEKNRKHPHDLILHLVWNQQSWNCNNFSFYVLPRPTLPFFSGFSWVIARKGWLCFDFLILSELLHEFLN